MDYSRAIFLINDRARAVLATYQDHDEPSLFKTFDQTIEKDDLVIVETNTRHGFTIVKVVETDVEVDMDSRKEIRWAVSKFDTESFEKLKEQEEQAIAQIKRAELRKKRRELRDEMFAEQAETLKALPIAHIGEDPEEVPTEQVAKPPVEENNTTS